MFPDPRLRRLFFEYPGSAGAGPRQYWINFLAQNTLVLYERLNYCPFLVLDFDLQSDYFILTSIQKLNIFNAYINNLMSLGICI